MSDDDLFKSNCERWSLFNREKSKELLGVTCKRIIFEPNRDGTPNLKAEGGSYHAQENPADEARRFFDSIELHGISLLLVYGIGLGYFYDAAKEWLRADAGRFLIILEDDLEVLYHLFHTPRGGDPQR